LGRLGKIQAAIPESEIAEYMKCNSHCISDNLLVDFFITVVIDMADVTRGSNKTVEGGSLAKVGIDV
jgi:hypothetical protein